MEWGTYRDLVRSLDKKKVKKASLLIKQLIETSNFRERVKDLLTREDEIKKSWEDFEVKIKHVINSVELGNVLKGKCQYCP